MIKSQKYESHPNILSINILKLLVLITSLMAFEGCKTQGWDKRNVSKIDELEFKKEEEPKVRRVWRSTLVWWVRVSKGNQEILEILKPYSLEFSTNADLSIHLDKDTLNEIKISNGQDMPILETINNINCDSISFSLASYFCTEKFNDEFGMMYIIFFTKGGHRQTFRVKLKNNDKQFICD